MLSSLLCLLIISVDADVYRTESEGDTSFKVWFKNTSEAPTHFFSLETDNVPYVFFECKDGRYELTILHGTDGYTIYTTPGPVYPSPVIFEWPTMLVNDIPMILTLNQGSGSIPRLDTYRLVAPTNKVTFYTGVEMELEQDELRRKKGFKSTHVYLIIPIVIAIILASRYDLFIPLLRTLYRPVELETAV